MYCTFYIDVTIGEPRDDLWACGGGHGITFLRTRDTQTPTPTPARSSSTVTPATGHWHWPPRPAACNEGYLKVPKDFTITEKAPTINLRMDLRFKL